MFNYTELSVCFLHEIKAVVYVLLIRLYVSLFFINQYAYNSKLRDCVDLLSNHSSSQDTLLSGT